MSIKAVILAAGMGTRLGAHAQGNPKCLLEIDGSTLLERSLTNLSDAGIRDAVIVLGFRGEAIIELIGNKYNGIDITYVENPEYENTGNMYSLAQAKDVLKSDTMILEGDLIYQGDAITRLIEAPEEDVILVGRLLHHGDDVFIRTNEHGHITHLGVKMENKEEAVGALLGISKYSPEFMEKLFAQANRDFAQGNTNFHYEETVLETSNSGHPIHALICHDIHWTEVDNENDLKRAREEVYPNIQAGNL
jgi:choline kinase